MAAEDRGPVVATVAILFLVLSWVAVTLRCYVRAVMIKSFGLDDWLAVASLILFSSYCAFVLKGVEYGTGQHLVDLPPEDIPLALKWWWCCELAYVASSGVLKAAIGVFLTRICIQRAQTLTIYAVITAVSLFSTYYFFLVVFQCQPVTYFWTQYLGVAGKCVSPNVITNSTYAHSVISAVADWTLGILPIFLVWNLNMNPRTKVSVALILALGAVGSTATIVRIPYIKQLAQDDFLYSTTDVAIWSTIEPGIGLVASNLACLRPLFRSFFSRSKLFGSATEARSQAWPSSSAARMGHGYGRSRAGTAGAEELGLRSDVRGGVGVVTTCKSERDMRDGEAKRSASGSTYRRGQGWNESQSHLKDDSSEEFLPLQQQDGLGQGAWGVRKTTEVRTSEEERARISQTR